MSWNQETNIRGPTGPIGPQGPQGPPGTSGTGTGNVNGPASAVDNDIAVFSGTTGTVIKDGGTAIAALALKSYVDSQDALKAPLASPVFTGDPQAPTPVTSDNDTSVATTAFVKAQGYAASASVPVPATATPLIESGAGSVGASAKYAREDHVHPLAGSVLEYANLAAFPATGTAGILYVAQDTNKIYHWAGLPVGFDLATVANVALSNNNLTATHSNTTTNSGARVAVAAAQTAGKYYFEMTYVVTTSGNWVGLIATAGTYANVIAGIGANTTAVSTAGWVASNNAGSVLNIGGMGNGAVVGIAVDLTARLAWFRNAGGNWNGSGTANPATGVGGVTVAPTVAFAPVAAFATGANDAVTANFGATAYANAAPAGFGNWAGSFGYVELASTIGTVRYDIAQGLTAPQKLQARLNIAAHLKGALFDLTMSTPGSSASFTVNSGEAADSTGVDLMVLVAALTKNTGAWAVGSGNGGLDTGIIAASTWYHVFLIKRPDTGVVDVCFSLSATAPTLPANYTLFRRIGSLNYTTTPGWRLFTQTGDEFIWNAVVNDLNGQTILNASRSTLALTVPTGITVLAHTRIQISSATASMVATITSLYETDVAPSAATCGNSLRTSAAATDSSTGEFRTRTDTLARIGIRASGANCTTYISTVGWVDRRGRDA
jgi:hypothetical protein